MLHSLSTKIITKYSTCALRNLYFKYREDEIYETLNKGKITIREIYTSIKNKL